MSRGWRKKAAEHRFLKDRLIRRDGAVCAICGEPIATMHDITLDHVMPISRGGETTIDNLQLAHERCNRTKRDMTPEEWAAFADA